MELESCSYKKLQPDRYQNAICKFETVVPRQVQTAIKPMNSLKE